jgi:hypothetical protein
MGVFIVVMRTKHANLRIKQAKVKVVKYVRIKYILFNTFCGYCLYRCMRCIDDGEVLIIDQL